MDALDGPGGGRRVNELLAFFLLEEEDANTRRQKDEIARNLRDAMNHTPNRSR